MKNLILIVGLQKSGTSLLLRLLKGQPGVVSPFGVDGKQYWGDDPPFDPQGYPVGELFQRNRGAHGHELGADDATPEIAEHLTREMRSLAADHPVIVAKNPFNTVRLPWLRAVFPQATLVCMTRDPCSNVYSLSKKYVDHDGRGVPPHEGWWGVKPSNWAELVSDNTIEQLARQWNAVNQYVVEHRQHCDQILSYADLCAEPKVKVANLLQRALDTEPTLSESWPTLSVIDDEYERGGSLRSRNRDYLEAGSLDTQSGDDDFPPLSETQIELIDQICGETQSKLSALTRD